MSHCFFSTERLVLRRWIDEDIPLFIAMNQDSVVMRHFPSTLTTEETLNIVTRIKTSFETNHFGLYAVELRSTGEFLGFTGFAIPRFESFFTPCIEIGWRYKQSAWGKGFATEAAKACLEYGFKTLGFGEVYSFTATINQPSVKVMQRIGMVKAGEFNHPNMEASHALCRHVLYKMERPL